MEFVETKNYISSYEQLISGTSRAMVLNSSFEGLVRGKHANFRENTKKYSNTKLLRK